MPFTSQNYGTFTGPNATDGDFIYDNTSLEGTWPDEIPVDTTFKLSDIAAVFFQNPLNYSGMHLYGVIPDFVVMERNTGFIPTFMANIANTIHNGNIVANGVTVMNGSCVVNGTANVNGIILHNGYIDINGAVNLTGLGDVATYATTTRAIANSKKSFDIPHPTKEGWRLSHVCVEGPSADVYLRGKLRNNNVIKLPEYWKGLIDP